MSTLNPDGETAIEALIAEATAPVPAPVPADKPRADLVALLLQFEACVGAGRQSSMYLSGDDAGRAVCEWCDLRGHRLDVTTLTRVADGKTIGWTHYTVQGAGPDTDWTVTCSLDDDHEVTAQPAQADQQVLARVQAALDGGFRCSVCTSSLPGPLGAQCPYEHWPVGYAVAKEQPQAAEGSV